MRLKKRNNYSPPLLKEVLVVPLEAALLADSAQVGATFTIQGQSSDGFYTEDDLDAGWGWD